jgi:phosphoglycolate phosphatase-like HAD superfamily hydrolase
VLPGVEASLEALESREEVGVGLLTGNYQRGAAIKLGHFGLWERFAFGAFGDAHADRRHLCPSQLPSAERALGVRVPPARVVRDRRHAARRGLCACARCGGRGGATGPFSPGGTQPLRVPDLVLETLEDLSALLGVVSAM